MVDYIVIKMELNDKWWDKWFMVGGLSIDANIKLHHYKYFSMSFVYLLTQGGHCKERILCKKKHEEI